MTVELNDGLMKQFVVFLVIGAVAMIYLRLTLPNFYNIKLVKFALGIDAYMLVWGVACNIHAFLDDEGSIDYTGFYFTILISNLAAVLLVYIYDLKLQSFLNQNPQNFKKDEEVNLLICCQK